MSLMTDDRLLEQLQDLELAHVAVTATIDQQGRLGPVASLWPKLLAAKDSAVVGGVRIVVVAEAQSDVPPDWEKSVEAPLRVIRAATLEQAVERLQDVSPREAVRAHERTRSAKLDILGAEVPIETHYQALPLLREVKRERLLRERSSQVDPHRGEEDEGQPREAGAGLRHSEIIRWEEMVLEEQVHYEALALEEVVANFQDVAKHTESNVPRFVVLGPPGSGKTTLIQYLAWRAACGDLRLRGQPLVPVRLSLWDWERDWVRDPQLAKLPSLPRYLASKHSGRVHGVSEDGWVRLWEEWLGEGKVLLLLDGLDELDDNSGFVDTLKETLAEYRECSMVLTCRTVSFERHCAVCPDFPVFTLAALDDAGRNAFIQAYPAKHPTQFNPPALIEQLQRMPAMRPLAANPLLLSLICLVVDDSEGRAMPATRGQLYEATVAKLLRRPARVAVRYPAEDPDPDEKLFCLERAALALFAQGQRRLTFTAGELKAALMPALEAAGYGKAPAPWANALRKDLVQNSGILRGDAQRGYFFLHLTIQEFLAASALARTVNEHGWQAPITVEDVTVTVEHLVDRKAWDPRWQEVILLFAGQLDDPVPLLGVLANAEKDDYFRHRLTLAAQCLGEIPLDRLTGCRGQVDQITSSASELCWRHYGADTEAAVPHLIRALPALAKANGLWKGEPLTAQLTELLADQAWGVRQAAAKMVGGLGATAAPEIVERLTDLFADGHHSVRWAAVQAIGRLGSAVVTPVFLNQLTGLLAGGDGDVRWATANAVSQLGSVAATPEIVARLADLLADRSVQSTSWEFVTTVGAPGKQARRVEPHVSTKRHVQEAAAEAVGKLGAAAATPEILERLADMLADRYQGDWWNGPLEKEAWGVRRAAYETVGRLGAAAATPSFLERLAQQLADEDWEVRRATAVAVDKLGASAATPEFLARLAGLLADANGGVRQAAAWAVGWLGESAATPEILGLLASLLADTNPDVRQAAAEAAGGLGAKATPQILASLVHLLADSVQEVIWATTTAIGRLGSVAATPGFLAGLADLLADEDRVAARVAARIVHALGASAATPEFIERLTRLLADQDQDVRKVAAMVVGSLGSTAATPRVLVLLTGMMVDQASGVREVAVQALGGLGTAAATPMTLARLADLMADQVAVVRKAAARAVGGTEYVTFRIRPERWQKTI